MPLIDPSAPGAHAYSPYATRPKPKKKSKRAKVSPKPERRTAKPPRVIVAPSPDAADVRGRTPAQHAHDKAYAARVQDRTRRRVERYRRRHVATAEIGPHARDIRLRQAPAPDTSAKAVERFKQSEAYVRDVQAAAKAGGRDDAAYFAKYKHAYGDDTKPVPKEKLGPPVPKAKPAPKLKQAEPRVGIEWPSQAKPPEFGPGKGDIGTPGGIGGGEFKGGKRGGAIDQPRTDAELRKFLKTGVRPYSVRRDAGKRKEPKRKGKGGGAGPLLATAGGGLTATLAPLAAAGAKETAKGVKAAGKPVAALAALGAKGVSKYVGTVSHGDYGPVADPAVKFAGRAAIKDPYEMLVTTPTNVSRLAVEASHDPLKAAGSLLEPYKEFAKHPGKTFWEHPTQTALMLQPAVRMPGRMLGRGARAAGWQNLEREPATLPGTALKSARLGSRDVFVRAAQARKDRKQGAPHVTEREVERRVDEFRDQRDHAEREAVNEAVQAVRNSPHHRAQPKHVRAKAEHDAAEVARGLAQRETARAFAREFGAVERPSVGAEEVGAAKTARGQAKQRKDQAWQERQAADQEVRDALAAARSARGSKSDRELDLHDEHVAAQRQLAADRQAATRAQSVYDRAHANARVSVAQGPERTPRVRELEDQRKQAEKVPKRTLPTENLPEDVRDARHGVRIADRRVNRFETDLRRAEEHASRMQGRTEGRTAAGRMTTGAGKAAADAAERVGMLRDALHEAKVLAQDARDHLNGIERAHRQHRSERQRELDAQARAESRAATQAIDRDLAAERARTAGVAPKHADALVNAIHERELAGMRVAQSRAAVRDVQDRLAAEQARTRGVPPAEHQRLVTALQNRDTARAADVTAREEHALAKAEHQATKQAHASPALIDAVNQGRTFAHRSDAQKVAEQLNAQGHTLEGGGRLPYHFEAREPGSGAAKAVTLERGRERTPLEFTAKEVAPGEWAVLPKAARKRLYGGGKGERLSHARVGTSPATGAELMRTSRGMFTQATLPLSFKWLAGQIGEAGLRALIARAGPVDYWRVNQVVKQLNQHEPGLGDEFLRRVRGGQFGSTGAFEQQMSGVSGRPLAERFAGASRPVRGGARALTWTGQVAPLRWTRAGFKAYSKGLIGGINHFVEGSARQAMAGQFIHDNFMQVMGDGIEEAARGLRGTHNQVAAARMVDDMYGKYSKWSPEMRSMLLHWTPYLPWYLNSVNYLLKVLPRDHPMVTALIAGANETTRDWRESQRMSTEQDKHVPSFLMGSYPVGGDRYVRVGHYTPFGAFPDLATSAADVTLPQLVGPVRNLAGVDWKWQRLHNPDQTEFSVGQNIARAGVTALEEHVPGASQFGRWTGLTPRLIDKRTTVPKTLGERLKSEFPWTPTKASRPKRERKASSGYQGGGYSGSGYSGGGYTGGGYGG